MDEYEEYEEIETDYYDEEDFTVSDGLFLAGLVIAGCAVIAFVLRSIRKTFKNVHLKIGDKVEIGIETKSNDKQA